MGRKESYSDRLKREGGMVASGKFRESDVPLTRAAADMADAALEEEFARLNPELHRRIAWTVLELDGLRHRAEAAEAERDRLRDVLERIKSEAGASWIADIASAALAGEDKP